MLSSIRRRRPFRGNGPWIVIAAVAVALLVTPFAVAAGEGQPVRGGARNPSSNQSLAYSKETQIIANNSDYGTRQSNKSTTGGGAIYGCRAKSGTKACLRASNLSNGRAFSFATSSGTEVGRIEGPTAAAPFTTTATGVATGLNADKVDGKDATDLQAKFATVTGTDGSLGSNRGATSSSRASAGVYNVVFDADVSKCSRTATIAGATPGTITTDAGANAQTVTVRTFDTAATPAATDLSFNLTVTC